MRSKVHENRAHVASLRLAAALDAKDTRIGLVLGTGWGDVLKLEDDRNLPFQELTGFERLSQLAGHSRRIHCGRLAGRQVVALSGRIHLNERPNDPALADQVRLQAEMLLQLGVTDLILTCAAGSLSPSLAVGDICVVDGFVTVFAPEMPLFAGEFCSPEDALDPGLRDIALAEAAGSLKAATGGYAMLRGPFFEGRRYDKPLLAASGASVVGMSVLPEACVAALYPGVRVLTLAFVTNDAVETHSHESNQARAKQSAAELGSYLERIVARLPR